MVDYSEDGEPFNRAGCSENIVRFRPARQDKSHEVVAFSRRELDQILRLYGFKVADGEWRDYAIDMLRDRAVFSVFRKSTEFPLFRIEKNPKLARRQGAFSIINAGGHVMKRGHDITAVLRVLESRPKLVQV